MAKMISGVLVREFQEGFLSRADIEKIPFNVVSFLSSKTTEVKTPEGRLGRVKFIVTDDFIDFILKSRGCPARNIRLYREWPNYEIEDIMKLESKAVGDCVRRIIYGETLTD